MSDFDKYDGVPTKSDGTVRKKTFDVPPKKPDDPIIIPDYEDEFKRDVPSVTLPDYEDEFKRVVPSATLPEYEKEGTIHNEKPITISRYDWEDKKVGRALPEYTPKRKPKSKLTDDLLDKALVRFGVTCSGWSLPVYYINPLMFSRGGREKYKDIGIQIDGADLYLGRDGWLKRPEFMPVYIIYDGDSVTENEKKLREQKREDRQKKRKERLQRKLNKITGKIKVATGDTSRKKNEVRIKIQNATVDITGEKTIIETPIVGMDGTVKELINIKDYTVTIKGVLITNPISRLASMNEFYPFEEVAQLTRLFENEADLEIVSVITDQVLGPNRRVVIKELKFVNEKSGERNQVFEMKLVTSDHFTLNLV